MMVTTAREEVTHRAFCNYQNSPMKVDRILHERSWSGRRCFLIGGGESLRGFDFNSLDNELTIGINKSFIYYESTLLFFSDANFYDSMVKDEVMAPLWNKFKGPKLCVAPTVPNTIYPDVYFIKRSHAINLPFSLEDGINVFSNSGYGAVVLAYLLGANPIYLLGYDMKVKEHTHWHCGYKGQTVNGQQARMHSFALPFTATADEFEDRGVKVTNLNPDSALECFDKKEITDVLK